MAAVLLAVWVAALGSRASAEAPERGRNPKADPKTMGSTFVALDSWVYPALERLAGLGYAGGMAGMRPWTRLDCARIVAQAKEAEVLFQPPSADAEDLLARLEEEFAPELKVREGGRHLAAGVESTYARAVSISGPALANSYHFGQTVSYDFGRPFERGTNGQAGGAFRAEAGPLAVYVRGEYQHAPASPAPSPEVLNFIALRDQIALPVDIGTDTINRPRVLDAYVAVNLSPLRLDRWQVAVGRMSHVWGPGPGSAFLLSDNAEPVDMVEVNNAEPIRLPLFLKFLGPVRVDHIIGRLANRTDHANPWIYGHKISFKPLSCLEIGYGRLTTIGGRGGDPFTIGNFFLSLFGQTSNRLPGHSVPGENNNEMDWTFYVPKVHNYIVLYGEVFAYDDFVAWVRPAAYPFRPGIYLTRIPGMPRLDLHIEAANTQIPGQGEGGNHGQFVYFNAGYHEADTNNGFLMGNTAGRDGQTIQGWLTYWASPQNTFQAMYKNNFVDPAFVPGGAAWQDYSLQNELHRRSGWYVRSQLQYEHISHYPLLFSGRQHNVTAIVELGLLPNRKRNAAP
jgi:hypothetical protein